MATNNNGTVPKAFCNASMKATSNGVFQNEDPLDYALPLAIIQICLVLLLTRLLAFLLRPLRQPRVVAEIIGGILLGPSALGRNEEYLKAVFPPKSMTVLDTLANLGLLFFLFLVGLELDPSSLRRTGKTSITIAVGGMVAPFALGIGSSFAFPEIASSQSSNKLAFVVFMGVAQSITAFGVLARILAELKLLTTDVGRIAMSAASLNDVAAWILLALAIALSGNDTSPLIALWVLLCGAGFVILCMFVVPPAVNWMARRCPEGESVDESYVCASLAVVLAAGFATDAIGIHVIFGAFVVGVLFPKGAFADALVNKTEDLITGLLLPLYFVSSGLKTDVTTIRGAKSWGLLVLATTTACFGKIAATVLVSLLCKVKMKESVALGLLMNTKGLVELIVLNIGKDRKVLHDQTFAIMVLMALFTTFITTPLVLAFYKPARQTVKPNYKHRKVERKDQKTQLRVLSCFHSTRNIPTMLNFIEASRGTDRRQGLCVYAMHLTELSERPSSILMVHKARKNGLPFWNKGKDSVNSDRVVVAFETFRQLSQVSIRPMTAISHMSTIHEDICSSAQRKRVAMIILPFHKHQKSDGSFETTRTEYHSVNRRVLENSPCSVGILIDRGIGENSQIASSSFSMSVTVLFFGGNDDHEALAYGIRMSEHPGVNLTVVRFISTVDYKAEAAGIEILEEQETWQSKPSDETVIAEVKSQSTDTNRIRYEEKSVRTPEEAVEMIGEFKECNLFLVGRKPDGAIATSLMTRKSDCPELGPIGNVLVSTEVSTSASVLVVQQYIEKVSPGSVGSARVAVAESPEQENSKSGSSSTY